MKYLIILFLSVSSILYSQDFEIKGRIINSSTQQPLESANISVQGKGIGAVSDDKGFFSLKGNLKENDILEISYIGFETKKILLGKLSSSIINDIFLENKLITSQTVLVTGTIAKSGETPISFSKLDRKAISETYTNQDVPELLSYTPSATFYSENGNGLGYNYLSIRGFDQKRISVAVNGIPQNEPEDHNVYWIDFPDVLEGTELIQVQRGAGSGIAGFAAIGGSINIITSSFTDKQKVELSSSLGSYNTRKYSASVSSGLIDGRYSIYAKLSQTLSSGYRNSSWVDLKSYHLSVVRYDEKLTSQINLYGGPIEDGLAYTGLPKFAVKDKNLRKANYNYWEADENGYTYTQERRPEEVEKFFQPHFELMNEYRFNDNVKINSALFLIIGNGYFDYDGSWADTSYFRLTKENGFNATENPANSIIRAKVENVQWGWIPRVSFKHDNGELILGGEMRFHNSNHWGSINYAENLPKEWTKDFKYYYYEGANSILNFYAHENFTFRERFNILAEAQFAYHNYKIQNERYLGNNFSIDNLFFNPRLGINYKATSELSFFFSFAQVSREPRLKNYYDAAESSGGEVPQFEINDDGSYNFSKPVVNPETMNDFEAGISFNKENTFASLNLFYMLFDDEIVKKGQLDRFGQPITGNMDRTLHYGIEAEFNSRITDGFDFVINGSISKNKIDKGVAYFTEDLTQYKFDLSGNQISGFPNYIFNAILKFHYDNLLVQLTGKYVGSFYSDNYDSKLEQYLQIYPGITDYTDNKVDAYFTANLYASYNLEIHSLIKNINIFIQANNLFDNLYATNAIGKEYFPAAERNILFGLRMSL
jgi:iron complex outermembrane recepter protein